MIELKPCPFCGSSNIKIVEWIPSTYSVQCLNCEARTSREYSKTLSIERWNNRHEPDNVNRMRNLLEDVVNALDLSEIAIETHGPLGTEPAELVKLVLQQKDREIALLHHEPDELPEWFVNKLNESIIDCGLLEAELKDDNDVEEAVRVGRRANTLRWVLSLRRGEE